MFHRKASVLTALLLGALLAAPAVRAQEPWTTEDILDERIDVDAQYSLMRMLNGEELATAVDASSMLAAIKEGELDGIYQADRGVPAQRARARGGNWWEIVPRGFDAVCYPGNGDEEPILVYRVGVGTVQGRLDPALRGAWTSCGLESSEPRGYRQTINKPPPPKRDPPPDLPPAPDADLTVAVVDQDRGGVAEAQVTIDTENDTDWEDTGVSGVVSFSDVAPGQVFITVVGPGHCSDAVTEVMVESGAQGVVVTLDCEVDNPDPPDSCDPDKYSEVFDPCGRNVLGGAIKCTGSAYKDFFKCKRDPICAAKGMKKFWDCKRELDHIKKIQECNRLANEASGCNYPGPK